MIYKAHSIVLKDGRSATLRAPRESDAEEMLEYLRTASGETEFLASYPEELKCPGFSGQSLEYMRKISRVRLQEPWCLQRSSWCRALRW